MKVAIFHSSLPRQGYKCGGVALTVHRLANALAEHERLAVTVISEQPPPT